ncbi:hypothetical protein ACFWD7_21380 [Streptomyces mirabilis]|uniref:hypothetical protein n=1 Tax=Streptomyces mirabilis TaxID=68239 RepID=UPI0021C1F924|nr:hypothetical protein [Streptomyces mirabilis]MCT9104480.1 hypothetical protein [Streptomyces mirabilis]
MVKAHVTTDGWVLIAGAVTIVYVVAMRWCMPTPEAKQRISVAPFVGLVFLVPTAVVRGYSFSHTLYLYSCVLLMFVIMLVPVRKRVMADIVEQQQKPWAKVPADTVSLYWVAFSATGCAIAMICLWPVFA